MKHKSRIVLVQINGGLSKKPIKISPANKRYSYGNEQDRKNDLEFWIHKIFKKIINTLCLCY